MPRVHEQTARKDYPEYGISKGDKYYWWKFRYGIKIYSRTPPKPQQLTHSGFLQEVYEIEEEIQAITFDDDLGSIVDGVLSRIEELRDQQEEKRNNMPEQLQDAPAGTLLQERYEALDEMYNELSSIDLIPDVDDEPDPEDYDTSGGSYIDDLDKWERDSMQKRDEIISDIRNVSYAGS